jgi:hypothetical protein
MSRSLIFILLGAAPLTSVAAQTPPVTALRAPPAAAEAPPDPARLAVAERLVQLVAPVDLIRRMLGTGMSGMDGVFDMSLADMGVDNEMAGMSEADRRRPMSEIMAERDPHFRERMAIRNRITGEVIGEVFAAAAPEFHRAMAEIYARRFSLDDLNAALAYYSTPAGRRFIDTSMTIAQDPAFVRVLMPLMPRIFRAMSTIDERVRAASAHLPPEPAPATGANRHRR